MIHNLTLSSNVLINANYSNIRCPFTMTIEKKKINQDRFSSLLNMLIYINFEMQTKSNFVQIQIIVVHTVVMQLIRIHEWTYSNKNLLINSLINSLELIWTVLVYAIVCVISKKEFIIHQMVYKKQTLTNDHLTQKMIFKENDL